jgi:hypothetical protein
MVIVSGLSTVTIAVLCINCSVKFLTQSKAVGAAGLFFLMVVTS